MKRLIVNKEYDGKKLNMFVLNNIENLSNNLFFKTLRKKDIKVNQKRVNSNIIVHKNDEVLVYISDELLKPNLKLNIVFEDDNILIINKPYNIEVVGKNSLTSIVHKIYKENSFLPMPCHRIDRNTTGLVLYAKNQESLDFLFEKFKNHEIEKHYYALVYGIPSSNHKKNEAFLFKDKKKSKVYISPIYKKGYSKIVTTYTVLKKYENNTCLLDVEIETGKTHQIRAHLAYLGYPIIGDGKYGKNVINKKFHKKYQMLQNYLIKFNFNTNAGILGYLNGKTFSIPIIFVLP